MVVSVEAKERNIKSEKWSVCAQRDLNMCYLHMALHKVPVYGGGGLVVLWHFQSWGVLLIWITVGQGPIVLAVGAGGGCLDIFLSSITFLSPSLWRRPDID